MNILVSPIAVKINPYIESFYCALKNTNSFIKIYPFRLKFFLKSIDLCHFHWPEAFLNAPSLYKRIRGLFLLYFKIKLLKVLKVKIVWTVHNFRPHEKYGDTTLEALFYKFWLKNVDALIFLSRASQKFFFINYSTEIESVVIPHGHYQDTFKAIVPSSYLKNLFSIEENDFVFGHYGLIRRYKNIPKLIKEFKKLSGDNYKLIVAGSVHKADENLKKEIIFQAKGDDRVKLHLHFIKNEEMKELYTFTNMIVLPFKDIVNSGSALLSLSMNCPIIVPDNEYMQELQSYVDKKNLYLFSGEFSFMDQKLKDFIIRNNIYGHNNDKVIDLKHFDWENIGKMTANYFHNIVH